MWPVKNLIIATMVQSANDAAQALAEQIGGQANVHHGSLVHDDRVAIQRAAGVAAEGRLLGVPFQQAVQGQGGQTGGLGVDVVTFYDFILRFDYSFNQLGQKGLFLHVKNDF